MNAIDYSLTRERLFPGFDGRTCKIDPKTVTDGRSALLFYQTLLLTGSDVFSDPYVAKSSDGGRTFAPPCPQGEPDVFTDGIRAHVSVTTVYYHRMHRQGFVLGTEEYYKDDSKPLLRGGIALSKPVFYCIDVETGRRTSPVQALELPFPCLGAVPHGQIIACENGEMLLTFYFTTEDCLQSRAITARAALRRDRLELLQFGAPVACPGAARGVTEPSMARLGGRYFLTLRTDEQGMLAVGDSPYAFSDPAPWKWDDGKTVENYNTMQRWVRFPDGLFLVYTRRGAHNDHVFRHRAPLFMTRFDEDRCCLIRSEEVILVPELGARLGNFSVTDVSDAEVWLTTAEWMQPRGCEAYGSDNSIWRVCIRRK